MAATPRYITQSNLEDIFGTDNIAVWSNLDNDTTDADTARIVRAIVFAEDYVEARLRNTSVAVPLASVTPTLTHILATIAAYWLYSPRGMRDSDTIANRMKTMRDDAEALLESIAEGALSVDEVTAPAVPNSPDIVPHDNSDLRRPRNIPWPLP
jgi:phage gp36-like protein